jgi:glutaredoxin 3
VSKVTIYTKVGCPYCAAAKKHFSDQGIAFKEIDVHSTPGALAEVRDLSDGKNIVPLIVENDQVTVGFGGG